MVLPDSHLRDTVMYSVTALDWPHVQMHLETLLNRHPPPERP